MVGRRVIEWVLVLVVAVGLGQGGVKVTQVDGPVLLESRAPESTPPARGPPCSCGEGQCGCCSGMLLQQLGFNVRQKGCMNVTYDPDEFAFDLKMSMNDRVLYSNTVSGKNPKPVCIPLPRIRALKFCVRFTNVYFAGRNVHACINMEGRWQQYTLYDLSFNCVRMGVDGVAVVRPEDGGGLPSPSGGEEEEEGEEGEEEEEEEEEEDEEPVIEDYDDVLKAFGDVLDEVTGEDDDESDNVIISNNTVSTTTPRPVVANNGSLVIANSTVKHKRRKPAITQTATQALLKRSTSPAPIVPAV